MNFSPELISLARYLAGEFDNSTQAIADPAWYVQLRLWHRPVPITLFPEPRIALFAEQANILKLNQPYRPRIMQLRQLSDSPTSSDSSTFSDSSTSSDSPTSLQIQYYLPKDVPSILGSGKNPDILKQLKPRQLEFLTGCTLEVINHNHGQDHEYFQAILPPDAVCGFTYQSQYYQVELGFEVNAQEFLSYDKGIDPQTGKGTWGALLGPYKFMKSRSFSSELML
ncbi:MAG: chorismate mutase [Okeania sp. SIO2C2]|uniref:chromophore lyase CpcT/CpeT n=1 Tax=Okeania sp. SIO2C2 TaxID=2607787 RepID=UPI0013BCAEB7|nr:chromophore lyase CpcT/CpeT [Okeania sp. SIO2C2]NEP85860.1 chorismate mutase [Okeania sp. SIO2C2]